MKKNIKTNTLFFTFLIAASMMLVRCSDNDPDPGEWTHPSEAMDFISLTGQSADDVALAMNDEGEAIIAWSQSDGTNEQIYVSEYRNETWTHPENLNAHFNSANTLAVDEPVVAMDNEGNAIVVWEHYNGSNTNLYLSEYRDGSWTHPEDATDFFNPELSGASEAYVAMDNKGNAIIAWEQYDGADNRMYKSEYREGTWTHPGIEDGFSPTDEDVDEVAGLVMNDKGEAIVVWIQDDKDSDESVFMSEYRDGSWVHPTLFDAISPNLEEAFNARVALAENGEAVIAWIQDTDEHEYVFFSEYRDGAWKHPKATEHISLDEKDADDLNLAINKKGDAVIVWEQETDEEDLIFASRYSKDLWMHQEVVNTSFTDSDSDDPSVAIDDDGEIIVIWEQEVNFNADSIDARDQLFFSEYRDGEWIKPTSESSFVSVNETNVGNARVAMSNNGEAIIVWQQSNETNNHVYFSEYRR